MAKATKTIRQALHYPPQYAAYYRPAYKPGIIALRPSCVDLDVFIDSRDTPERVTLPFGARNCDGRG